MNFGELTDEATSFKIMNTALEAGINFFDTADVYSEGESEKTLGQTLKNLGIARKDVVIATKVFGRTGPGRNDIGASRGHIMDSVEASLRRSFDPTFGVAAENTDRSTCYNDVGSSYLCQIKWFFQTARLVGGSWTRAWNLGANRLRLSESFDPSKMIWLNDEYCDITINQVRDNAQIRNGYGDINRAIVVFLDGHARYMKMIPGGEGDPNAATRPWLVPAYFNSEYTVVFPDLKP